MWLRRLLVLTLGVGVFTLPIEIPARATVTWTQIYELRNTQRASNDSDFAYQAGYEKNGTAYTNFVNAGTSWNLIRIRMQMTRISDGLVYYADVSFDKWAGATLTDLQFPDHVNSINLQKNVTNINVSSNLGTVKTGSYALGRIEFWPYNYSGNQSGGSPSGGSDFDWDDTPAVGTSGHGSYQFFNLTDTQTVFAWNRHRYNDASGPELGIGPNNSGTGSPDWTFNNTVFSKTNFIVQVFVGQDITTGSIAAPTFSGSLSKGVSKVLTANTNGPGQVTFYYSGKRIAGCIRVNLTGSGSSWSANCNFKPPSSGRGTLSAIYQPTSSSYTSANSSQVAVQVGRRTTLR